MIAANLDPTIAHAIFDDPGAILAWGQGAASRAVIVDGGYRVSGGKIFASQSGVGDVMSTMFAFDDPEQGRRVLNMAVPLTGDGIRVLFERSTTEAGAVRRVETHSELSTAAVELLEDVPQRERIAVRIGGHQLEADRCALGVALVPGAVPRRARRRRGRTAASFARPCAACRRAFA